MKPGSELVFAMSMTLRASWSFGFMRLRALESFMAISWTNASSSEVLEEVASRELIRLRVRWWWRFLARWARPGTPG